MVGSIYACFYLSMLPDAIECRAEIPPSTSRKSQMTVLVARTHAFFLMEDPLPEPAQTLSRITSFSGKLIQFVTLPSVTGHYTWPVVTIFFRK